MTEQATPEGSTPRPVPDLGFFGAPSAAPPSQYGAPPSQVGPPPGQVGPPPGQFGAPPNQFAPPPSQFGAAPVPPFGAGAPPVYAPYPAGQQRGGMPGWAIALIAVAAGMFIVMVLAAIGIPTFLNQRAKAADAETTVSFPANVDNLQLTTNAASEEVLRSMMTPVPGLRDVRGAFYSDGPTHSLVVTTARFSQGSGPAAVDEVIAGFRDELTRSPAAGVTMSALVDRDPGRLGGRISCATYSGATSGQVCLAVDTVLMVTIVDEGTSLDPDLPRRVREAVVHRP